MVVIKALIFSFSMQIKVVNVMSKFEYSHYLFAEECIDIVGRSFMLITSGS